MYQRQWNLPTAARASRSSAFMAENAIQRQRYDEERRLRVLAGSVVLCIVLCRTPLSCDGKSPEVFLRGAFWLANRGRGLRRVYVWKSVITNRSTELIDRSAKAKQSRHSWRGAPCGFHIQKPTTIILTRPLPPAYLFPCLLPLFIALLSLFTSLSLSLSLSQYLSPLSQYLSLVLPPPPPQCSPPPPPSLSHLLFSVSTCSLSLSLSLSQTHANSGSLSLREILRRGSSTSDL